MPTGKRLFILSLVLVAPLVACRQQPAPEEAAETSPLASLEEGWNAIDPAGETICSDGSPWHFFVRPADPAKLMVYFQGGGACWTGTTCDPEGDPTYTVQAREELRSPAGAEPEEGAVHGILAFGHPENPFADYSVVFVPYCTGDVHIGDRETTYTVPASEEREERQITVRHRGYTNAKAALEWTYDAFGSPETIFVTGSSAGAIPSPLYARILADHYSESRIVALGDGAGGYRNTGQSRPQAQWGTLDVLAADLPEYGDVEQDAFSFESLYIEAGKAKPELMLARYDTAEDEAQIRYLEIGGGPVTSLLELLDANEADIDAAIENYRSYVAPGELHTILLRPEFYTYAVDGVRVRDWVAGLAVGRPVEDVHCGACDQTPTPEPQPDEATGG